ncbi:MAG TPA: hypothetical protein VLA93_00170 [Pyrinomonadaceae bacterium]|nr:hypothetical protein [Pyrinomonadaceae bacterium]
MSERIRLWVENSRTFGNGLTFEELAEIEEAAHHSTTDEATTILRLAAALREAMQIEESALALISLAKHKNKQNRR